MSKMGLVTLKSGFKRLFTLVFPETEQGIFNFPEFLLFDTFLKIGYYTFIIPFRFYRNAEGQYKVRGNVIQLVRQIDKS